MDTQIIEHFSPASIVEAYFSYAQGWQVEPEQTRQTRRQEIIREVQSLSRQANALSGLRCALPERQKALSAISRLKAQYRNL